MAYLGDFATGKTLYLAFTTLTPCGKPVAFVSGAVKVIKNGLASGLHATGVTLAASAGSITGYNKVTVAMSGALYTSGEYQAICSTGSAGGINLRGYVLDSWSIKARNRQGYALTTGNHDTIGTRVWANTTRLLTSGAAVWAAGTRSLTDKASFTLTTGQHDTIGTRVWANGTRILTSGAAVWAAGTKVLTSGGVVWTAGTRSLTDKAGFALTTGQHDSIATRAWAASARTLTSGAVITTAALTEQASVPAAAPTLGAAIQWNYQAIRNKRITTATADKIHTSATAVAGTAVLSFVTGGTFTKGKYA